MLFVYALFRWCMGKKEVYPFDIVPLFETMKGMAESEAGVRVSGDTQGERE